MLINIIVNLRVYLKASNSIYFIVFVVNVSQRNYGERAPLLWNLIVRVLSQSTSICKHNKSVFEKIHISKQNKIKMQQLQLLYLNTLNHFKLLIQPIVTPHGSFYIFQEQNAMGQQSRAIKNNLSLNSNKSLYRQAIIC